MLITEEYRKLNAQLHEDMEHFGRRGSAVAPYVMQWCDSLNTRDVLDYGCGKGNLNLCMPFAIQNYDPAFEKYSSPPRPADIVVCSDVLEHIEPECLDDVLQHLRDLTKQKLLLGICMIPAKKTLPDGRNAHLIVEDATWWEEKLSRYFDISVSKVNENGDSAAFIASPK